MLTKQKKPPKTEFTLNININVDSVNKTEFSLNININNNKERISRASFHVKLVQLH